MQTQEVVYEIIISWLQRHSSIAQTDANIAILRQYIADHFVAGETIIDDNFLNTAYQTIAPQLQLLVTPQMQVEIQKAQAAAAEAQQQSEILLKEKQAKERALANQMRREAEQMARQPGPSSAFANSEEREERARQQVEQRRKDAEEAAKMVRYREFQKRVYEALHGGWQASHSRRESRKEALLSRIRFDFPEFASLVPSE